MTKKILLCCALIIVVNLSNATYISPALQRHMQQQMDNLSSVLKMNTKLSKDNLPQSYEYLLSQPLMTLGIEKYYQRTPIIQTIYALHNSEKNTYSRVIILFVDSNRIRNNAKIAQVKKEAVPVVLATITMNFNELPQKIINDVLNTQIPLGKLLTIHHLQTSSRDTTYFSVNCSEHLTFLLRCKLNSKLYGRTNTIVRRDNKKWVAHVVEVLAETYKHSHQSDAGMTPKAPF